MGIIKIVSAIVTAIMFVGLIGLGIYTAIDGAWEVAVVSTLIAVCISPFVINDYMSFFGEKDK